MVLGIFAVGQFAVKIKNNLIQPNILFDGEVSHSEKSAHDLFVFLWKTQPNLI